MRILIAMKKEDKDDDVQMRARDAPQLPPLQRLSQRRATTERFVVVVIFIVLIRIVIVIVIKL